MAIRVLAAALLASPAAAHKASEDQRMPDVSAIHAKCYSLLQGMGSSAYSKTELAMICRSKLPMEVCTAAATDLGEKPWSPSTIERTCGRWEEQWTERALKMSDRELQDSVEEWQAQVDDVMAKKATLGICKSDGEKPTTVEECAMYKKQEYPKYTEEMNDALQGKYKAMKGQTDEKVNLGSNLAGQKAAAEENAREIKKKVEEHVAEAKENVTPKVEEAKKQVEEHVAEAKENVTPKVEEAKKQAEEQLEKAKKKIGVNLGSDAAGQKATAEAMDNVVATITNAFKNDDTRLYSKATPVLGMSSSLFTATVLASVSLAVMVAAFAAVSRRTKSGAVRVESEADSTTDAEMSVQ